MKNAPAVQRSLLRRQHISADTPPTIAADISLWERWRVCRIRLSIHAQTEGSL
jgi:hypothetical protein